MNEISERIKTIANRLLDDNPFVREVLRGDQHNKKRPQSCENWFQIELAKELWEPPSKIYMEQQDFNNLDIVFGKEKRIGLEVKIHKDHSKVDTDKLKKAIKNGSIEEGYLVNIRLSGKNKNEFEVNCKEVSL